MFEYKDEILYAYKNGNNDIFNKFIAQLNEINIEIQNSTHSNDECTKKH
jgi:hypothetical protein